MSDIEVIVLDVIVLSLFLSLIVLTFSVCLSLP
jgi:hypothetical protein